MDNYILWIICLITILISVSLAIYCHIINLCTKKRRSIVENTSEMIKNMHQLNSQYHFNTVRRRIDYTVDVNTKAKFDNYNLSNFFNEVILNNSEYLLNVAELVISNKGLYSQYNDEVNNIKSMITQEETKQLNIPYDVYVNIEQELFNSLKLHPVTECIIVCNVQYISPKGRNQYVRDEHYNIETVPKQYEYLQQQQAYQNSDEAMRKKQRALMTDKLRYKILKRDGFKCVLCGRTVEDGVKLHIDHIIPVSKGGKTVPENLRTLCENCNWGKGDEIE